VVPGVRRRWPDSLLTRLLLTQAFAITGTVVIFGALMIIERNVLLAPRYAELWEPALRQVLASPAGSPALPIANLNGGLRHETDAPAWRMPAMPGTVNAVREVLEPRGIHVIGLGLAFGPAGPAGWIAGRLDGGEVSWVSVQGYPWMPGWSRRISLGLVLMLALVSAVSLYFVRRVTRPLAALQARMLHHARTGQVLVVKETGRAQRPPPELQAMDQAYTQLADRLLRNERERALLLAGVSHDLRSPLTRIRLAAEMLPESPDNAGGVAAVTRNVDVADRLIASFLEFVRTGTHQLEEAVDAVAVVQQAVTMMSRPSGELTVLLPANLVLRQASALLLERLVVNLADNALKHGAPPVQVLLSRVGDDMQLAVVDQGAGLPAEAGNSLLEAFARGDSSRGVPGFGLGLAIVHQIVVRLQGQLHFEQGAGGHSVKVIIPLSR
jgi:two-component system osmolarity sensor histidine kinase EnvZ